MAFVTISASGRKIDSPILVYGYFRHMEKQDGIKMPMELKLLCFQYWLNKVCDSWCDKYHTDNEIKIENEEITSLPVKTMTLYGNHVVMNGSSYIWKVKMNKFGYGNVAFMRSIGAGLNPIIGIIKNDEAMLQKYKYASEWPRDGYGYAFVGGSTYLRSKQDSHIFSGATLFNEDGDVIFIHLDLEKYTLGYTINDKYCGIAFNNITPDDYRLAVAFCHRQYESKLEFI